MTKAKQTANTLVDTNAPKAVAVPPALTNEQLLARIAELEKSLANKNASGTRLKVSEKGAVSFYGTGRWPITLYASQWEILFSNVESIKSFIEQNKALLSFKPAAEAKQAQQAAA